jgi:hypothetical protein
VSSTPLTVVRTRRRTLATPRIAAPHAIVAVATFAASLLLVSRVDYIPMWDGYEYALGINAAAAAPFHPGILRLAGHASHAYALLATTLQLLAPGHYWPLLLTNALLLGVAVIGFHRLSSLAFPGDERATDRALLTSAFVLHPALLSGVVQPGLDLPLVPGFVWATVFLLEGRWLAAAATGTALVFTKETGVLVYGTLVLTRLIWEPSLALGVPGRRVDAPKRVLILSIPAVAFGGYLLYRTHSLPSGEPAVWNAGTAMIGQPLWRQLLVPRIDRYLASYLAIMLVLSFAWVVTLFGAAGLFASAKRAVSQLGFRRAWRVLAAVPGFLVLLTAAMAYVLTRFASYANARYLMVVMTLMLLLFLGALIALRLAPIVRRSVLAGVALLMAISNVRTIDPLSRLVFGTFKFGDHEMLRMNSISRECCAFGRDQLVYSLEFTTLAALTDDALAAIGATKSTLIVLPDSTHWRSIELIDVRAHRRTLDRVVGVTPLVAEADSAALYVGQSSGAFLLALPNGSTPRALQLLDSAFTIGPERRLRRSGYWLSVYPLSPRADRAKP